MGPEKLNDEQRRDLLEIVEDRYEKRSTILTSQIPVDHWYERLWVFFDICRRTRFRSRPVFYRNRCPVSSRNHCPESLEYAAALIKRPRSSLLVQAKGMVNRGVQLHTGRIRALLLLFSWYIPGIRNWGLGRFHARFTNNVIEHGPALRLTTVGIFSLNPSWANLPGPIASMTMIDNAFVLTLACEDRVGIVAAVTAELVTLGANIAESNQFWDRQTNRFFMRIAFTIPTNVSREDIERLLKSPIERFDIKTSLASEARKPKLIIMVSKFDHALLHLLYQIRVGRLNAEVAAIVSNHEDSRRTAELESVPYCYWPVTEDTKAEQEQRLLELVKDVGADLVVLARYMQVLSADLSKRLYGKAINIHHSFLPSFKGAKPYHQAFERGVKIIGATAHYVTSDLDEGPIIEQETERVSHAMSAEDFVAVGRDIESRVLARAVKSHLELRVLINGHKTVIF